MSEELSEKESAEKGKEDLIKKYNSWTAGHARFCVQAAYAIIAANWVAHPKPEAIITNGFASASIALCVIFISINIFMVGRIAEMNYEEFNDAEKDEDAWIEKYRMRNDPKSKWPYTQKIENWAKFRRILMTWLTLLSGIFFVASLFS